MGLIKVDLSPLGHMRKLKLLGMNEILYKKVSPPFEGGVVGKIDYHIYTVLYFPTGVVDSLISSNKISIYGT
jgi:hypothetical protein